MTGLAAWFGLLGAITTVLIINELADSFAFGGSSAVAYFTGIGAAAIPCFVVAALPWIGGVLADR